jgi:enoyl-[acyl-carrier protein] reductase III
MNAFITGGTRGIGRAVTLQLLKEGYKRIYALYLQNDQEAEKTKSLVSDRGGECVLIRANLADLNQIDDIFKNFIISEICLRAFIHCAALNAFKPLSQIKPNQWDLTMNINTRAFLYLVQQCRSRMLNGSAIVAISSLGSRKFIPDYGAMGPAKAAMEAVVRYLAAELAADNINVNAVCGGVIQTESIKKFPHYKSWLDDIIARTPAGRIGCPEDIAAAVAFLCRDEARYITGQVLVVDGGLSL